MIFNRIDCAKVIQKLRYKKFVREKHIHNYFQFKLQSAKSLCIH